MAYFYSVEPTLKVGAKVRHKTNPNVIMVILGLVFEKLPPARGVFGIYQERKNAIFYGSYLCEWLNEAGKQREVFHQDSLELIW